MSLGYFFLIPVVSAIGKDFEQALMEAFMGEKFFAPTSVLHGQLVDS
jgi:hypothetical protein